MTDERLHIDFESRSLLDLTKVGTVLYSKHPSTYVWCFAWAFNAEKVRLWEPGQPIPPRVLEHINNGGTVSGFSVQFEYHMWNFVLTREHPYLPLMTYQQLDCTQARAVVMGLPRSLDALAGALDQKARRMQKDAAGRRLMLQMARPRFHGTNETTWWDDPDRRHRLGLYCIQDVEVERWAEHHLRPLTAQHRAYWEMDFRMNFIRGIQIDTHLVAQSRDLLELAAKGANRELRRLTNDQCTGIAQVQGMRDWLATQGVKTDSVNKERLQELLDSEHVTGKAREVLQLRQDFGKSSLAKIAQFTRRTDADGRMHGLLLFNGAGPGRWTGQGAQLHNLPRPELDPQFVDYVVRVLRNTEYTPEEKYDLFEMLFGAVLPPMSDAIRGFIVAKPGHKLLVRDFSNIEGRCIARIAGEQWKLDAFAAFDAGHGPDLYKLAVARAFGIPVESVDSYLRQLGKTMELSLGFAGGAPALNSQARKYGIDLSKYYGIVSQSVSRKAVASAEWGWSTFGFKTGISERTWLTAEMLKLAWRETNPAIVQLWNKLEEAALSAVREPKKVFTYRNVSFQLGKIKGIPYLMCQLPSGRLLYYPYATWIQHPTPWGEQKETVRFMGINPITKKWSSSHGRGGLWAENITQGDAFDFIAAAMLRCENAGFPPVLSVHDENVAEAPEAADDALYGKLMAQRPPWARNMPLAVDGFAGPRYAKK